MSNTKKGVSVVSLALCVVAVSLIVAALVVTTNNAAMLKAQEVQNNVIEDSAYIKVYTLEEVKTIAKQAYVNNYLSLYEGQVDLAGFEMLVIKEMQKQVPIGQLNGFNVFVSPDGIEVQAK